MDDKATKRGGGTVVVLVLVVVLVVLPILYVLSIGPVVCLVSNGAIAPSLKPAIDTVYSPLEWTVNNVPLVGTAIVWYAELWRTAPPVALPAAAPVPAPSGS
jgi:hypothetical protein